MKVCPMSTWRSAAWRYLFYIDHIGPRAVAAFVIGVVVETAALTLLCGARLSGAEPRIFRRDIDLPSTLQH